MDLVVAGASGTRVLLGNGDGTFQTSNVAYATGESTSIATGMLSDGALSDLVVISTRSVYVLANDGMWKGRHVVPVSVVRGPWSVASSQPDYGLRTTDPICNLKSTFQAEQSVALELRGIKPNLSPRPEVPAALTAELVDLAFGGVDVAGLVAIFDFGRPLDTITR
jgi:hypothetical protein